MLLGCAPTRSARKGDVTVGRVTGKAVVARTGLWMLWVQDQSPESLDRQIEEVLALATSEFDVWRDLTAKYKADLFCGLFMSSSNDGVDLSASTLGALCSRGLALCLDVYGHSED